MNKLAIFFFTGFFSTLSLANDPVCNKNLVESEKLGIYNYFLGFIAGYTENSKTSSSISENFTKVSYDLCTDSNQRAKIIAKSVIILKDLPKSSVNLEKLKSVADYSCTSIAPNIDPVMNEISRAVKSYYSGYLDGYKNNNPIVDISNDLDSKYLAACGYMDSVKDVMKKIPTFEFSTEKNQGYDIKGDRIQTSPKIELSLPDTTKVTPY